MFPVLQQLTTCLFLLLWPLHSIAQLTVTSPVPRMVFQRSLTNDAAVTITGMAPASATLVEARFVPLAVGQGSTTAWTPLPLLPGSSAFSGRVTVSAGWYRLDVRATANNNLLAQTQVSRVGVGEVFVVAGQSNVYGYIQSVPASIEDRVSCVDFQQDSLSDQLLPLQFSRVTKGSSIGPSQPPHLWSILGDKLVQRLNVPVLFLGAALGGSSSTEWQQGASGNLGTTTNSSVYRRLGEALLHYVARTGVRAVLWHQGETDTYNGIGYQTYYNNLSYILQKSRQQTGSSQLAWMVSRVSYYNGQTNPGIIAAQNQIIADLVNVFPGPASDSIVGPDNRPDGIHMKGPGLIRFTNSWDQALSSAFFQQALPYIPTDYASVITSAYTLPLNRRQGDTIAIASLRSNPNETDNQYIGQIVRTSDGVTVYESAPSIANPILVIIPANLPDGQYQFRTRSTHPAIVGTLSEPFTIQQSTTAKALLPVLHKPIQGGTADAAIKRFTYRYEPDSHGFFALIESSAPVEVRLERTDGGIFGDAGWNLAPPSSQAPDYDQFDEFNYVRNYPPIAFGVGGVSPGTYRYSVRIQGDTGPGLWFDLVFLADRTILYQQETIPPVPPILTLGNLPLGCLSGPISVFVDVAEGSLNSGNQFSVTLSNASGSFTSETTIGTGTSSPLSATIPATLPSGNAYRIRVTASSPAVASAPSQPFSSCNTVAADLSMALSLDTRTPALDQPVTFTLVIANDGPGSASAILVQSLLPAGMSFVDASSPAISASANTVTINVGSIEMGNRLPFVYRLRASQSGSYAIAAQITASSQTDPDSQPNSGTGDGQDDEAIVDLRTPDASGPQQVSPNPNQVPLPPVQSNQPPTDPAKADLSLALSSSDLAVAANQPITVSVSVFNRGGATATMITVQTLLPTGWQLTDTNGLTVNGQIVTGSVSSIPAGGSATLILSIQAGSSGTLRSQLATSSPPDPDSTPGNGYTNGEDDEASVMVRVR